MYYEMTVLQFAKMLQNLDLILDKAEQNAEARQFEISVLLNARLAPDQFNFIRQIQMVCDTAKFCVARLCGKEAPAHEDTEQTLTELKKRIQTVITYLNTFSADDFTNAATRKISQPRWKGKWLTGQEYLCQHALPNFYFHFTTAYSILRNQGVDVGKKDYLGLMPYKE